MIDFWSVLFLIEFLNGMNSNTVWGLPGGAIDVGLVGEEQAHNRVVAVLWGHPERRDVVAGALVHARSVQIKEFENND